MNEYFDTRVDGLISDEINLKGKPNPDIFLEAAKRLDVSPSKSVIFEDAIAGIEAGKKGGFYYVVGVQRKGDYEKLKDHGADIVVSKFYELDLIKEVIPTKLWPGPKEKALGNPSKGLC